MKKKVLNIASIIIIIMAFMIIAVASSGDSSEKANRVESDNNANQTVSTDDDTSTEPEVIDEPETNDDESDEALEGSHYSITYKSASTWKNSIGTVWVQAMFEITNVGTTELYLSSGAYDLEDSDGKLVKSSTMVSVYPTVLSPGESAMYHETTTISDLDEAIDVVILPRPDIRRARIDNVRLDVTEVEFSEDTFSGIRARGRVTNTTDEEQTSVTVAIILYDSNDNPLGVLSTTLMEDIAPDERIGFETSGFTLPDGVTPDTVARYVAFAYPWLQFQWR